jgi:hypothetical protein
MNERLKSRERTVAFILYYRITIPLKYVFVLNPPCGPLTRNPCYFLQNISRRKFVLFPNIILYVGKKGENINRINRKVSHFSNHELSELSFLRGIQNPTMQSLNSI